MSQRQQLERIMLIDAQIRDMRYPNAKRVAEKLEVSQRVIFQDKAFMVNRLGAPIEFDRQHGGWYYADQTWTLPSMFVSDGELMAFFLSIEVAHRYLGTAFEAPLRAVINRLVSSLGNRVQVSLDELRRHYSFAAPSSPAVSEHLLADIHTAIQEQKEVSIRYFTASRNEWTERVIHPYHLYNLRGDWYLFAYDLYRQAIRNFHLGRVDEWKVLETKFERAPGFSPEEWMRDAFQYERGGEPINIVIRFDTAQSPYIRERLWHETQQPLEELPDGCVILRFKSGGLNEVKRWVMQFGSHAEVIEPTGLRKMVHDEVFKLAEMYKAE